MCARVCVCVRVCVQVSVCVDLKLKSPVGALSHRIKESSLTVLLI